MPSVSFRFYAELNEFLPREKRGAEFLIDTGGKRSVKDMVESLGIPHTEIDLILINGLSVGFDCILEEDDRVSVYPVFESVDITNITWLRQVPLRQIRFVADNNIGDIVKYMRVLGFDVYAERSLSKREIIDISLEQKRIILTKSRRLLKFKDVTHGILIRSGTCEREVRRIIDRLDIKGRINPFSRCLICNSLLKNVSREEIIHRIPPRVKENHDEYAHCEWCDRIYWKGTHHKRMRQMIHRILE